MLLLDDVISYYMKLFNKEDVFPTVEEIRVTEFCDYRLHKLIKQMKKKRRAMLRAKAKQSTGQSKGAIKSGIK